MSAFAQVEAARSLRRAMPPRLIFALSLALVLGFCVICGAVLWQVREAARAQANQTAINLATALGSDIARNIEVYDLALQGAVDNIHAPEFADVSLATRKLILFDRAATAKHMGSISVTDATGAIIAKSGDEASVADSFAGRDFFEIHRRIPSAGLYVSGLVVERNGEYVLYFSRRVADKDGAFAGIAVGTLQLGYFHDLFRKINVGPTSTLALYKTDGQLLMRSPFNIEAIGRRLDRKLLFGGSDNTKFGQFETVASIDGVERLYTFKQVGDLPLVVFVGLSTNQIFSAWSRQATIIGLAMLVLCAATIGLSIVLTRELRWRRSAEHQLNTMARTDGLTKLANRFHFDEMLKVEWRRSMREGHPISLLMIDADHFKSYNDRFGHQAGDALLQAIATCIRATILRADSLSARYGGEEFAVLLPGIELESALLIAERIRNRVADLDPMITCGGSTVSIGVASMVAGAGGEASDLIRGADIALYEAKRRGRDRTVRFCTVARQAA